MSTTRKEFYCGSCGLLTHSHLRVHRFIVFTSDDAEDRSDVYLPLCWGCMTAMQNAIRGVIEERKEYAKNIKRLHIEENNEDK